MKAAVRAIALYFAALAGALLLIWGVMAFCRAVGIHDAVMATIAILGVSGYCGVLAVALESVGKKASP